MIKYYILDTETTGVNPNYHEMIEISVLRFEDRMQMSRQIKATYPKRFDAQSLRITGRRPEDLYRGAPKEKVIESIHNFIEQDSLSPKERCIIAFVAHFDRNFVYKSWKSVNKIFPAHNWLDAKALARIMAKQQGLVKPKLDLQNCLKIAGVNALPGAHTAEGDTQNTYLLVDKAMKSGIDLITLIKSVPQEEPKEEAHWSNFLEFEECPDQKGDNELLRLDSFLEENDVEP